MKLHLGSGGIRIHDYVNVDRRYMPGVDRVDNIGILSRDTVGSVSEIYVCHALDHFDRWTYKTVLKRWYDLLEPMGTLRISTPDFAWTATHYRETGRLNDLVGQLYAAQDYPDNVRHWIWDFEMAKTDLESVGFRAVALYNPKEFLGDVEDCSVFVDSKGRYRSLNVAAQKL